MKPWQSAASSIPFTEQEYSLTITALVNTTAAWGHDLILDEIESDVASQLDDQSRLGIQITRRNEIPDAGPTNKGVWYQIPQVTAVFADLKRSTELSAENSPRDAASAYTYFIRAMALILERFDAKYIDIQGDGIFGLFSGKGSIFYATACAITMRTEVQ